MNLFANSLEKLLQKRGKSCFSDRCANVFGKFPLKAKKMPDTAVQGGKSLKNNLKIV